MYFKIVVKDLEGRIAMNTIIKMALLIIISISEMFVIAS